MSRTATHGGNLHEFDFIYSATKAASGLALESGGFDGPGALRRSSS